MLKIFLSFLLFISPIWPLGENPLVGDPYIIVNKQTNEMAYLVGGKVQKVYTVATGRDETLTPEGEFTIVVKAVDPYYRKKNIVGGAKENPLGTRWIGFDALGTDGRIYGIHGNNDPASIGKFVTNGCVRMFNEEVEELYLNIPLGTRVYITDTADTFEQIGKLRGAMK